MVTHLQLLEYNATTRHFIGELSEVGGFVRIWADSADLGLVVHNPDTGRSVTFVVVDEAKDADGDITHWLLKSVTGTREDGRFSMTIYND
jgi:hypothetical protein